MGKARISDGWARLRIGPGYSLFSGVYFEMFEFDMDSLYFVFLTHLDSLRFNYLGQFHVG
jgi:hypothetical protein